MKHQMKLSNAPFNRIKNGTQIIESRILDTKRQKFVVGDQIEFTLSGADQKFVVRITDLLKFGTFSELYSSYPPETFGGRDVQELMSWVRDYYSVEEEQECGVVGIKLEYIN